jgi:hypothetical protein
LSSARLMCHTRRMNTPSTTQYKHHRFPAEIISHGVWLYFRFCLSYRDVEELLFARGIIVTYGVVIYGPTCHVKGLLNQARIGTDAVIYPALL